ncbi:hypothetical protein R3I94_010268 [Phoxinus phoxinus]
MATPEDLVKSTSKASSPPKHRSLSWASWELEEALVPDYVHLSTALLPNPFQLQELTATAFLQYTMDIVSFVKYMVCPVKMNRTEMMTRMPKCCGWGAEMTMRKCSRSIR